MKIDTNTAAVPPAVQQKLHKAAEDFAAVALNELLKPMFDTVDNTKSMFSGGEAEQQFKPMMIAEVAKQIARSGGLGITEPVYQQMLRMQEQRK